jgi:hypothetical protein
MYVINISPEDTTAEIIYKANYEIIGETILKELNMKFWVREINPDFFKELPQAKRKKYR